MRPLAFCTTRWDPAFRPRRRARPAGTDTAVFSGPSADYTVTAEEDVVTVKDQNAERDGENALRNIERLRFTDKTVDVKDAATDRT